MPDQLRQFHDVGDLLPVLIEHINKIGNAAEEAAIARKLGIAELIPMLNDGANGFATLAQKANDLGIVLDQSTIAKADEAKRKLSEVGDVVQARLDVQFMDFANTLIYVKEKFGEAEVAGLHFLAQLTNTETPLQKIKDDLQAYRALQERAAASPDQVSDTTYAQIAQRLREDTAELKAQLPISHQLTQSAEDRAKATKIVPDKSPKARSGGEGTEWTDELREAELQAVQDGQGSAEELLQVELAFWQEKVSQAKVGSAQYKQALASMEGVELDLAKQAAAQKKAIAESDIDTQLKIEKAGIDAKKSAIEADFTAGTITAQQKHDMLVQLLQQETQDEIDALEAKKKLYGDDVVAVAQADNQEKDLRALLVAAIANLDKGLTADMRTEAQKRLDTERKTAEDVTRAWKNANSLILDGERELISGIFSGRESLSQILGKLAIDTAEREIEADVQYQTEKAMLEAEGASREMAIEMAGKNYKALLFSGEVTQVAAAEAAKTGATAAGVAQRTAAESTGAATTRSIWSITNQKQIMADAAKAASGAYSALAGIPIIGPVLAPAGAAAAFVAVEAFGQLASLDVGTNYVPNDMTAQIHQGERVMPRADNAAIMDAVNARTGGALTGVADDAGGDHFHFSPVIHALDPAGAQAFFDRHGDEMMHAFYAQARGGKNRPKEW